MDRNLSSVHSESGASPGHGAGLLLVALFCLGGLLDLVACVSAGPVPAAPVPASASSAFREARSLLSSGAGARRIEEAARRALAEEPDWAAPARFLDDRAREELGEARALGERLRTLSDLGGRGGHTSTPLSKARATALYLVGRLEGSAGRGRFEEAVAEDPSNPWPHHGSAWMNFREGELERAWEGGLTACRLARDPWERAYFLGILARYGLGLQRPSDALEVFEDVLGEGGAPADPGEQAAEQGGLAGVSRGWESSLLPAERLELAAWRAALELSPAQGEVLAGPERAGRGITRALALFGEQALPEASLRQLTSALASHALAAQRPSLLEEARARLLERDDAIGYRAVLSMEEREAGVVAAARLARTLRERESVRADEGFLSGGTQPALDVALEIQLGRGAEAIEDWLARLPRFLLTPDGLPHNENLRRVVLAARATPDRGPAFLGEALLEAGWFSEALSLAIVLRGDDNALSVDLEARARRGIAVVSAAGEVFHDVDQLRPRGGVHYSAGRSTGAIERPEQASIGGGGRVPASVGDVLDALAPAFARYFGKAAAEELRASPRLSFGPFATLVHPGPAWSADDEQSGFGPAGESVPGLARLMGELGRFAIIGTVRGGGGPDGSILRLLDTEVIEGAHLGVPFTGTVAWCEGQDLRSRPGRRGARITGAALHEGYWVDVAAVRNDAARWLSLQRRWLAAGEDTRMTFSDLETTLRDRGPELNLVDRARSAPYAPGQVADRVRLAVLLERARAVEQVGNRPLVPLEELLEVVARHEEGHLCDRTRFLPLGSHLWRVLRFAARHRFSSAAIARQIEARAQLTALCVVADPRIPLADVIDAVGGGTGVTPHAAAYTELLEDLLALLDASLEDYPDLDGEHLLLHQLPRLGAEDVRTLARELARREGLLED